YASFSSPAVRRPGQPIQQAPPAAWWLLDAESGHVAIFAARDALDFADGAAWERVTLPRVERGIDELRDELALLDTLADGVVPDFLAGRPGGPAQRRAFAERLVAQIPAPLLPQHRALAPDFFDWLEISPRA